MTRSIYVIGGAGTGKSTFTEHLINQLGLEIEPHLLDLHSKQNAKALVTLRGHHLVRLGYSHGIYLGVYRENFPGSDGLDRATSPTGAEWLRKGDLPPFIISEGATLATRPFLTALHETTRLLLVWLVAEPEEVQRRFKERGSNQDPKFVLNTVTRSANLADYMAKLGTKIVKVAPDDVDMALDLCEAWI